MKKRNLRTPYYVIHKTEIEENLKELKKALQKYWKNSIIGYSFKTNNLPWIIDFMKRQGLFAEVVSDDEYILAERLGYSAEKIIYNGPIKGRKLFFKAVRENGILNIDSKKELEWLLEEKAKHCCQIGIRVNFDIETECPGETQCGKEDGRFGFCFENGEFERAVKKLEKMGMKINGLHLHCSSKTRSCKVYMAIARKTVLLIEKYNLELDYVDIGGGFFGGLPGKPSFDEYIKVITEIFQERIDKNKTKLIVEPGMSVTGAFVDYVTSVVDVKETLHNYFIVTDGSRTNIDPLMNKNSYFYEIIRENENVPCIPKQTVCGFTCMEHDRIIQIKNEKEMKVGDLIVYHRTGAYTMCLTPLFIQFFPDVYVKEKDEYTLVRRKWTVEEFLRGSIFDKED